MKPEESRDFKRKFNRTICFLLCVFLLDAFVVYLLINYAKLSPTLSGFIIILITSVLYLCFWLICAKIDKKKEEKLVKNKFKDPFSKK